MRVGPDVLQSITENRYELSGCWLWASEDIYTADYREILQQPTSLEATTIDQCRFKADEVVLVARSGPAPDAPVVFACTAYLLGDTDGIPTTATDHASLSGLLGTGPEYVHLNAAQQTGLTAGGDTTLHHHSADRARANHTGTQLATTISDFGPATISATAGVYQPISAELSALAGLSSTGYAKRTGAGAWSVVASIPQADVSGLTAALAGLQPLDSDLTAIAALTTTAFGRSLLTVADAAAARTAIGAQVAGSYQASSSVLTSIATQSSGTGLLKLSAGVASLDSTAYATAASLSSYLPLSAGSGKSLTGTLYGTAMVMATGGTAPTVGLYAWPVVPASRTFIGLTSQDGTSSSWGGTTGLVLWTDNAELSAKVNVGIHAGGVSVLGATSSLITLGAALSGTTAAFGNAAMATWTTYTNSAWFGKTGYNTGNLNGFVADGTNTWCGATSGGTVGLQINGLSIVSATASAVTLSQPLSGTSATFSAGVVASSFRSTGWAASTSYLMLDSPTSYWAGIVVSGSGSQQTQTFAQVDINGALQRRSDIAANAADFGGLVYGGAYDVSTYTTPGFAGNWASTGHWGIIGDNTSTLRFRALTSANADAGSFANIAVGNVTGTTATFGNAALGSTNAGTGAWFGFSGWNGSTRDTTCGLVATSVDVNLVGRGGGVHLTDGTTTVLSANPTVIKAYQQIDGTTATFGNASLGYAKIGAAYGGGYFGSTINSDSGVFCSSGVWISGFDNSGVYSFSVSTGVNSSSMWLNMVITGSYIQLGCESSSAPVLHTLPGRDAVSNLGSIALRWNTIYSSTASISSSLTTPSVSGLSSLIFSGTSLNTVGGTDYATATLLTNSYSHCITGQIAADWFKLPSASANAGRLYIMSASAPQYGMWLTSASGSLVYADGTIIPYNVGRLTPSSMWISNGTNWYQVG